MALILCKFAFLARRLVLMLKCEFEWRFGSLSGFVCLFCSSFLLCFWTGYFAFREHFDGDFLRVLRFPGLSHRSFGFSQWKKGKIDAV